MKGKDGFTRFHLILKTAHKFVRESTGWLAIFLTEHKCPRGLQKL